MNEYGMSDVVARLDSLIRLVAVGVCGDRSQKDKITLLGGAGLTPKTIADILGTTPNTVSVALSISRKEQKKGKKQRSEAVGQ